MKPLEQAYWWRLGFGIIAAFLALGYLLLIGPINTNLALNPSVETPSPTSTLPQNWTGIGNITVWNSNPAYVRTGTKSLEIDVSNSSAEWIGDVKPIIGGKTYEVNAYFSGQIASGEFSLSLNWSSSSGPLGENSKTLPTGNNWQNIKGTFTSPSDATTCQIIFEATNASGHMYADDFDLRQTEPIESIFNSASIAVIVYIASYYFLKSRYSAKVTKPQKLLTTGIGIYILAWITIWTLLYSIAVGI